MAKDLRRLRCPCCREKLEFDTRTGKVRKVVEDEADKGAENAALDKLLDKQKQEGERLGDAFSQASEAQKKHADQFDDLFSNALEEAKKDKDKKPRNPFDMD